MINPMPGRRLTPARHRRLPATLLLVGSAGLGLLASQTWEAKPFTEWTGDEARQILSRSPWVKEQVIGVSNEGRAPQFQDSGGEGRPERGGGSRGGGDAVSRPRVIRIIWVADPVRKAHARLAQLDGHLAKPDWLDEAIRGNPEILQINIEGAFLARNVRSASDLDAIRARSHLQKRNGDQIPVERVILPETYPRPPQLTLVFARHRDGQPLLTVEDREVRLILSVGGQRLTPRFQLREMLVGGELMI